MNERVHLSQTFRRAVVAAVLLLVMLLVNTVHGQVAHLTIEESVNEDGVTLTEYGDPVKALSSSIRTVDIDGVKYSASDTWADGVPIILTVRFGIQQIREQGVVVWAGARNGGKQPCIVDVSGLRAVQLFGRHKRLVFESERAVEGQDRFRILKPGEHYERRCHITAYALGEVNYFAEYECRSPVTVSGTKAWTGHISSKTYTIKIVKNKDLIPQRLRQLEIGKDEEIREMMLFFIDDNVLEAVPGLVARLKTSKNEEFKIDAAYTLQFLTKENLELPKNPGDFKMETDGLRAVELIEKYLKDHPEIQEATDAILRQGRDAQPPDASQNAPKGPATKPDSSEPVR